MKKLIIVALVLLSVACSKDDDNQPTKKELFARTWKQTDLLASIGGSAPASVFTTFLTACQQDNLWQFKSDGTYTVTEGATKCGTADVVTTGTWTFIENDTKVTFVDATNGTQTFTLSELTSTSLKLSGVQTYQGNAVNVTAIFTGN
jgi:hypothetical protein